MSLWRVAILAFGLTNLMPAVLQAQDAASYRLSDGRIVAPLDQFQDCDVCPEMIVMPMGRFMMGAKIGESRNPFDFYGENAAMRRRGPNEINIMPFEHPRHAVTIDIPFAIGRNEVTQAEFLACFEAGGCDTSPATFVDGWDSYQRIGPDHPAVQISYDDMLQYVAWLNTIVGADVYRLPTEAEWEYAARAGTETRFAQGDDVGPDQANFSGRGTENLRGEDMPDLPSRYMPVAVTELDAANAWGLRHMSGNVHEFTMSCWTSEHLRVSSSRAYLLLAQSEADCRRVFKGGGYNTAQDYSRPAARYSAEEDYSRDFVGFRVVRELQPVQ